jgi:hypothetical protein
MFEPPSIQQLSNVIAQVTGPAFLLAAEAQLLDVLVSRLDHVLERAEALDAMDADDTGAAQKSELPILQARATLLHTSISWGVASCVTTSVLVILSFLAAFVHLRHEYGSGLLFVVAMTLFTAALIAFGREVKLAYSEIDRRALSRQKRAGK